MLEKGKHKELSPTQVLVYVMTDSKWENVNKYLWQPGRQTIALSLIFAIDIKEHH
jgi:hypothetical protein